MMDGRRLIGRWQWLVSIHKKRMPYRLISPILINVDVIILRYGPSLLGPKGSSGPDGQGEMEFQPWSIRKGMRRATTRNRHPAIQITSKKPSKFRKLLFFDDRGDLLVVELG